MKREKIGTVGIDSGEIILIDPTYVVNDLTQEQMKELVVYSPTGYGDGIYPVYATKNKEGRTTKLEIIFIDEGE